MASSKPILIAGGGIGGLTAALCLARKGFETIVFEQAPAFDEIGAGLQVSPNGSRVLHHLGLAAALRECAGVPSRIEFRRWRSGKVVSVQPLDEAVRTAYGFPYYHLHRGDLLHVLARAAQRDGRIELLANASVRSVEQDATAVRVAVATGAGVSTYQGIALVGADGIHSTVRDALFGKTPPAFTGYVAWRTLVDVGRLPAPMAQLPPTVWWGAGGHFVHYFVRGGALLNCVGVVKKAGWEIESWTEPGEQQELRADFGGWHSDVRTLIERMEPDSLYKWALFDREPLRAWGKGRVTLLGDACHPMLPFLAQGAASAIEDAAVLAACLANGSAIATGLRRYEALRRPRTAQLQRQARRNGRIFHLSGAAGWLRDHVAGHVAPHLMDGVFHYDALTAAD